MLDLDCVRPKIPVMPVQYNGSVGFFLKHFKGSPVKAEDIRKAKYDWREDY